MVCTGPCVSKLAICRTRFTTSPESAPSLYDQKPSTKNDGYLAPLPLVISTSVWDSELSWMRGANDIISALGNKDRILEIAIRLCKVPSWIWQELLPAMREPLPALANLVLWSDYSTTLDLPASFLGGSAPLLQSISLNCISYPALPILLSSARDLVDLQLLHMPNTWYISPKDMAACLSSLTKLTTLVLQFASYDHVRPAQVTRRSSQQKRTILHSLILLHFRGAAEYLEDLVARFDAPRLSEVVARFVDPIVADISQLSQFIGQADDFQLLNQADIIIPNFTEVELRLNVVGAFTGRPWIKFIIPCEAGWNGPLSTLEQVCVNSTRSSPPLSLPFSTLEHLTIWCMGWWPTRESRWLEFLTAFTAVKNLYLSDNVTSDLLPVLKDATGESTVEVLPALQNIFLEERFSWLEPVEEVIQQFTTVRRLAGRPVAVHKWTRK
jgi:hypothetical protein